MQQADSPDRRQKLKVQLSRLGKRISLVARFSGILLSVISMHLLIIRPLVNRVDQLQAELRETEIRFLKISAEQSTIRATNDLLTELRSQHDEIAGARATLLQLQKLREEIQCEAQEIPAALEAISRISELPDQVHHSELGRLTNLVEPSPEPLSTKEESKSTTPESSVETSTVLHNEPSQALEIQIIARKEALSARTSR